MKIAKLLLPVLALGAISQSSVQAAPIKWQPSVDAALKAARRSGKPVFIDFYATWCGPCHILDKTYLKRPMQQAASRYIMVKVDVDKQQVVAQKYGATSLPTMVFLNSRGKVLARKIGFSVAPGVRSEEAVVNYVAKDLAKSLDWIRKNKA